MFGESSNDRQRCLHYLQSVTAWQLTATRIGDNHITEQGLVITALGLSIMWQKWSHANLCIEWDWSTLFLEDNFQRGSLPKKMWESPIGPIGIPLPGTELLDSPVRMEFSTESFQAGFIWLSTEFSSGCRDQQVWRHYSGYGVARWWWQCTTLLNLNCPLYN